MTESLSYFQQYTQFADACSIPQGNINARPNFSAISLAKTLVAEEYCKELVPALLKFENAPSFENLAEVADGIVDTIYVLCQLARALGVPLDTCWDAVQSANMAKVIDGTVLRRADGKILKPDGWKPPDILKILLKYSNDLSLAEGKNGAENWAGFKKEVKPLKADDDYPAASNT